MELFAKQHCKNENRRKVFVERMEYYVLLLYKICVCVNETQVVSATSNLQTFWKGMVNQYVITRNQTKNRRLWK